MKASGAYTGLFPEMFKLLNIILVGTASVERSFSQMKQMRIAIEGQELSAVNFKEVLEVFKEKNCRIRL